MPVTALLLENHVPNARETPPRPLRAALVVILTGAAFAPGCEVRDEQPLVGRSAWWWPAAVVDAPAGRLITAAPVTPSGGPVIEFVEGFEAGARRASTTGLPMLVVFRARWCRWSAELAAAAAADPHIVALSRRFVCVTVDADRDAATCREFGVEAFPTVLLVEADGSECHRAVGAAAADSLAQAMEGVLEHGPRRGMAGRDRDPIR